MFKFLTANKSIRKFKCFHYQWYCNHWKLVSREKEQDVILNNVVYVLARRGWEDTKNYPFTDTDEKEGVAVA